MWNITPKQNDTYMIVWEQKINMDGSSKGKICVPFDYEAVIIPDNHPQKIIFGSLQKKYFLIKSASAPKIYFIKKSMAETIEIPWGVGDISYKDQRSNILKKMGVNGSLKFGIQNSKKLVKIMINSVNELNILDILNLFENKFKTSVKTKLTELINNKSIDNFEKNYTVTSNIIKDHLFEVFDEYGLSLVVFNINGIIIN